MIDFVVGAIVLAIVGAAAAYIIKSKKKGVMCVGCPDAKSCASCRQARETAAGSQNGACTGCSSHTAGRPQA